MAPVSTILPQWNTQTISEQQSPLHELVDFLREGFGVEFSIWDTAGQLLHDSGEQPDGDVLLLAELVRTVAQRWQPEFVGEEEPVLLLALPLNLPEAQRCVAVAAFVTRHVACEENVDRAARLLALEEAAARSWINRQAIWTPDSLLRLSASLTAQQDSKLKVQQLEEEVDKVSQNLSCTYEEICLLYGVTQNLRISSSDEELARLALDWLTECLPARGVAIQYLPVTSEEVTYKARVDEVWLTEGDCPLDCAEFAEMIQSLDLSPGCGPLVANPIVTSADDWRFAGIRQMIVVPVNEGTNNFGWLAAFNHVDDQEFGTVEASLLNSVGAILGIHSGNRELYRQQAEFLANVVRALTSAIDAKDPYTCGHSDRVARMAVRLARQMGHSTDTLNTLYMAGLLHDIGKIGIDDSVLRKPGRLSDAEYEHIKLHPELGYKILADLKQLADVLPVVLHHHEQWDGGGYPHALQGDNTPILARITAVADAFDAMTSDRPYRKGMPIEQVEDIFLSGAGKQWDAKVIEAYFAVRDDIIAISRRERANLSLDVQQWT